MSQLKIYDLATGTWKYVSSPSQMVAVSDSPPASPYNGMLWWDTDDASLLVDTVAPVTLANDPAFTGKFVQGTAGAGAPAGTGTQGQWYYDTTNKRLYFSDGIGWIVMSEPEQVYTPTLANVTLGTGSPINSGRFRRSDGFLTLYTTLTLGTGGSFTSTPTVTLPSGITSGNVINGMISAWMYDVAPSALQFQGIGEVAVGGNLIYPRNSAVNGSNLVTTYSTSTAPFTWAAGDSLNFFGRIPMNTRYM